MYRKNKDAKIQLISLVTIIIKNGKDVDDDDDDEMMMMIIIIKIKRIDTVHACFLVSLLFLLLIRICHMK